MRAAVDKGRFGPRALVTGASSGIGKEFARQIAGSGINIVLACTAGGLPVNSKAKLALVTGGNSGIGLGAAAALSLIRDRPALSA